jgi:hypothetical protein
MNSDQCIEALVALAPVQSRAAYREALNSVFTLVRTELALQIQLNMNQAYAAMYGDLEN